MSEVTSGQVADADPPASPGAGGRPPDHPLREDPKTQVVVSTQGSSRLRAASSSGRPGSPFEGMTP
ncbi:hypothetical protein NKH77_42860 [Streptomyces sp. M19]